MKPSHVVRPGLEPVVSHAFIETARRLEFKLNMPEGVGWRETRQLINRELDGILEGLFDVILINQDQDLMEFRLYLETDDLQAARDYLSDRLGVVV